MEEEKVEEIKIEEVNEEEQKVESEEKDKGGVGKLIILISLISIVVLAVLIFFVVSFFNKPKEVVIEKKTGGEVSISYTDKSNTLNVVNALPVEDSAAIKDLTGDNYFEFSVETQLDGAEEVTYEISVSKNDAKCTTNDSDIRIYLEKENSGSYSKVFGPAKYKGLTKVSKFGTPKGDMVLANVTNKKSTIENYRLKIWLSNSVVPSDVVQNYSLDINVLGKAN